MKRRLQLFYPPKLNPQFVWVLQRFAPWIVRWSYQLDLVITTDPRVQLSTLRGKPCLLLCNHPTFQDPLAMFLLSARLGEPFYYLAAHERFRGIGGWLYQQIGAYSIRRGQADRDSVAQTLKLLMQPDCKLAIFPEGGCSFQNDTVMPFRPGAIQMALQTMAKRVKQGEPIPDLYVVPISLKYRYTGSMASVIGQTLSHLERAFAITTDGDVYNRLRIVAEQVLLRCEREYGLVAPAEANWNQRITALKVEILRQCEQQLGVVPSPGEPNRERVYRLQHALESRHSIFLDDGTDGWEVMRKSIARILNFDAIYDGYVAEKPTPERFLDTLVRLEREVFEIDQPPAKGYRQAFLRVGTPINLKDHFANYSKNRSGTVTALAQQLQQMVQHNLDILAEATARGISW